MEVINTSKSNGKRGGQFDDHGHSETVTFLSPESSVDLVSFESRLSYYCDYDCRYM